MSKTKIVIVGASHGGHESAIELLDKYRDVDVTIYEAGDFVSFMSCGMELFLEDKVTAQEDVRNFKPEDITSKGGHVFNNHEVTAINADKKEVSVKDVKSGQTEQVAYDKLVLSSGVTPTVLPVPGHDLDGIYAMRGYDWASKIKAATTDDSIKNVAVIGAGYIGIEAAEVFTKAGKHVTLMDMIDRLLGNYLNENLTDVVTKELTSKGVELALSQSIKSFEGDKSVTGVKTADKTYPADLVICAAGVKPNTAWLSGTVNLTDRGFIDVNPYLQTNLPDVYAIGDAILPLSIPAGKPMPIALATTARREAQYVVDHIFEDTPAFPFKGVVGASALSVFDYHFATAGLNTTTAAKVDVPVATSAYKDTLRPAYVPESAGNTDVYTSLTFDPLTHQILGGAVLSKYDITAQGNVIALAVAHKLTLEDLATADFFFQPGFDRQWSLLNLAAQHALGRARF
ncbi:MAG: FAD-dependent oxidoreductase [Furfurilactobacillus sp.]|jgi:NADH peroxidase|uniref:FAD-dependent oxidoreductase n=1 Tax=Furfurilactobacillus TaxID=2767882 RepID=UPI001F46AB8B|nr:MULTISPECIES: FAD-dependent oxidoreductase [Furfurilactobacillus]MCF6418560.1 FAD-dependent oxidoreductase [Furfurilactobacillus milii]MCH4012057.1 FAD-dependent oxidoreductase [Furfurilactobacillus sp.]MCH4037949.1 FAD-dependent oxidoreductase [Furfurilactobacillus sp.]MCH4115414.1 FAD-dependent oxidoreductase [Furfurilactobacillus sp.]MCI1341031.1 FAD-dependent oxidoreductase [Furfurilactobacillus sp.]